MIYGYAIVPTLEQSLDMQIQTLKEHGHNEIITEKNINVLMLIECIKKLGLYKQKSISSIYRNKASLKKCITVMLICIKMVILKIRIDL